MHVGVRPARDPEAVSDRIKNEENKDEQIGDDQDQAPGLPRRHPCRNRCPAARRLADRDRRHRHTLTENPGRCRGRGRTYQPATCLIRAIISSTALSTGTFSLTTRFMAFAPTFSLLRMVNL